MRVLVTLILIAALSSAAPTVHAGSERDKPPKVGDPAPLFRLPELGSDAEVDLHEIVGNKPIVLFFGSYT